MSFIPQGLAIYFIIGEIASWVLLEVCNREMKKRGTTLYMAHYQQMRSERPGQRPKFKKAWGPYVTVIFLWLPMAIYALFQVLRKH